MKREMTVVTEERWPGWRSQRSCWWENPESSTPVDKDKPAYSLFHIWISALAKAAAAEQRAPKAPADARWWTGSRCLFLNMDMFDVFSFQHNHELLLKYPYRFLLFYKYLFIYSFISGHLRSVKINCHPFLHSGLVSYFCFTLWKERVLQLNVAVFFLQFFKINVT